jgi:sensor histidine kinase YesM
VENNFDPGYRALRRSGIGLANVRSRLEARYDGDARMDAGAQGDRYRVEIVMPVNIAATSQASAQ